MPYFGLSDRKGNPITAETTPNIRKETNKGKYTRYVVDYGRDSDRKRVRRTFNTREDAEADIKAQGKFSEAISRQARRLTDRELMDATEALSILAGHASLKKAAATISNTTRTMVIATLSPRRSGSIWKKLRLTICDRGALRTCGIALPGSTPLLARSPCTTSREPTWPNGCADLTSSQTLCDTSSIAEFRYASSPLFSG